MDPLTLMLLGGGMSLASGALNFGLNHFSAKDAARDQYHYQSNLLRMQQDFVKYMSNTAHQREVADLREAGLNPILSATGGNGATSPVVSAPSSPVSAPTASIDIEGGVRAASQIANTRLAQYQTEEDIKLREEALEIERFKAEMGRATSESTVKLNNTLAAEAAARTKEIQSGVPFNRIPGSALNAVERGINSPEFQHLLNNVYSEGHSALQRFGDWVRNGSSKKSKGTVIPVSDTVHDEDGSSDNDEESYSVTLQ